MGNLLTCQFHGEMGSLLKITSSMPPTNFLDGKKSGTETDCGTPPAQTSGSSPSNKNEGIVSLMGRVFVSIVVLPFSLVVTWRLYANGDLGDKVNNKKCIFSLMKPKSAERILKYSKWRE